MKINVTPLEVDGKVYYTIEGFLSHESHGLPDYQINNHVGNEWKGYGTIGVSSPERCLEFANLIKACVEKAQELDGNVL